MQSFKPKISVLLPTYNCAHLIEEAITSVLNQSFYDFELLIIDDGSKDHTAEIVSKFLDDQRVTYHYKENTGLGNTLNYGINLAKGAYIIRMDADDISVPTRFEKLFNFMEQEEEVVACGSGISYFIHNHLEEQTYSLSLPLDNDSIVSGLLNLSHSLCHASLIFRTETAREIGGYEIPGIGEEWDFFLQLSKKGQLRNLEEALYIVRLNPSSVTSIRYLECYLNNKFSIFRYKNNLGIDKLVSFKKEYLQSYLHNKLLLIDNLSLVFYRRGIKYYLLNKKYKYLMLFFLAGLLSPLRVWNRLVRVYQTYGLAA